MTTREFINKKVAEYGDFALGHAFIWGQKGSKKEVLGYAAGSAELDRICEDVKEEFGYDSVWYNLD